MPAARRSAGLGRGRAGGVVGLLLLGLTGCRSPAPTLASVRAQLDAGRVAEACRSAEALVERADGPVLALQLDRLRLWIDCLERRGALDRAERWLGRRARDRWTDPALVSYGRGLLAVARSPSGVEAALRHLAAAARRCPTEAELPFRQGLLALADERPSVAYEHLYRACRLRARAACWAALAHAELDLGNERGALETVRRVLVADPRPVDVARGRALVQRLARRRAWLAPGLAAIVAQAQREALAELGRERPDLALQRLRPVALRFPQVALLQRLLGLTELRAGHGAEALRALQRARQLDPLDATSARYAAAIARERGAVEEAVALLRAAVAADPFSSALARELGNLLEQQRQHAAAARVFDRLVLLEPSVRALHQAARAWLAAGHLDRARLRFERVLARVPDDLTAHRELARLLAEQARRTRDAAQATRWRARAGQHLRRAEQLQAQAREAEISDSEIGD